jgi:2-alkyl-3-oxoalkanoate reductase
VRVLVSGAHGFVGSHLVEALLARDHEVRALISPWGKLDNLAAVLSYPALELRRGDISEPESLAGLCKDIDVVFHAAARAADWGPWDAFYRTNVLGTKHLLKDAAAHGVRRFVFVSSVSVHRYAGFRNADPRSLPRDGGASSAYARSKIMAEDLVMASAKEPVVVRPGLWLFGPRDPNFLKYVQALRGENIPALFRIFLPSLPIVGSGRTVMNTCYVENLAHGLILAGEADAAAGNVYVIADEGSPTWLEVFGYLAGLARAPEPKLHLPPALARILGMSGEALYGLVRPGQDPLLTRYRAELMVHDVHFNIDAAREELGYRPMVSWQEGMRRTVMALEPKA